MAVALVILRMVSEKRDSTKSNVTNRVLDGVKRIKLFEELIITYNYLKIVVL